WDVSSAAETKARLMADGEGLCDAIDTALAEHGMDYTAELHLGRYDFPDREYAGVMYPAGEYEALRVILGDGAGKNWWCVMFPPLCILEATDGEIEKEAKFDSLILKLIREVKSGEDQP
ncbi:MAG: stage II sporulation protein R, partial [Clostridia bacterium]|nr:stage II sporulation protein R [Clostridia bacterium]